MMVSNFLSIPDPGSGNEPPATAREELLPVPPPPVPEHPLAPRDILLGQPLSAVQVIATYSHDEWERFVREWVYEVLGTRYAAVFLAPGAGDQGRDVVAYETEDPRTSPYDNFQCKHYGDPLAPGDIWVELGKLCWYTFRGDYGVPRRYYFVAPKGIGPRLLQLLEQPEQMRAGLIAAWDAKCATQIHRNARLALDGDLRAYVDRFDFGVVRAIDPQRLVAEHSSTRYHAMRFGGGLRRTRPESQRPPEEITPEEATYVRHLLDAYSDSLGTPVPDASALGAPTARLRRHLARQREWFFKAATLRQFERDSLPHDAGFVSLMQQVYEGVIDVVDRPHEHGLARLEATLDIACQLHITRYVLRADLDPADLKGVCHHLANEDQLCWCERDDFE
jgi:hypothetical protein